LAVHTIGWKADHDWLTVAWTDMKQSYQFQFNLTPDIEGGYIIDFAGIKILF
jgi:hypothetical protein